MWIPMLIAGAISYWILDRWVQWRFQRDSQTYPIEESEFVRRQSSSIVLKRPRERTYRLVYYEHPKGDSVPLFYFIHGLGGQLVQFDELLVAFSRHGSVLAVDLLGHGQSSDATTVDALRLSSLAQDLCLIYLRLMAAASSPFDQAESGASTSGMESHRAKLDSWCRTSSSQRSLVLVGHSLGASLSVLLYSKLSSCVKAVILIGPRYRIQPSFTLPVWLACHSPRLAVNLMRIYDHTVARFLHRDATVAMRRRQMSYGVHSRTTTLLQIIYNAILRNDYPCREHYEAIQCPSLILFGEDERVNMPTENVVPICKLLGCNSILIPESGHNCMMENPALVQRVIERFLVNDVPALRFMLDPILTLDGGAEDAQSKWSLKNYEKWKRTTSVSPPVPGAGLRGMKVMREGDPDHSPVAVMSQYPDIGLILDLSHDPPPYLTETIPYRKLVTTSKVIPSRSQIIEFIAICQSFLVEHPGRTIAVHCHYGFNRTGFMICCYLIEAVGMRVEEALQAWAWTRPPGIRHDHFKDALRDIYSDS